MEKRKSFIIHIDTLDVLDELNTEQKASLFDAIRDYHLGNEVKLSGLMRAVFIAFENQFKRDENKYLATTDRNRENGKKGGRPNEDRVSKSLSGKTIPKHSDSHWVYLLQDDDSGEIKIGETQNLYNRRQTIKRSSYHLVYIDFFEVKDLSTALKIESEFKNEFKINYLNGDWFNMSNLDIEKAIGYLKTHPLIEKAKKADSDSDSVSVSDNDSKSESDSDIGISAPATKKIDWKEKREQRKKEFYESLTPFIGTYTKEMLRDFYEYWTEHGENDRLVKHEKKDSFSIPLRLATWHRNDFNKQPQDNLPRKKPKTIDDL